MRNSCLLSLLYISIFLFSACGDGTDERIVCEGETNTLCDISIKLMDCTSHWTYDFELDFVHSFESGTFSLEGQGSYSYDLGEYAFSDLPIVIKDFRTIDSETDSLTIRHTQGNTSMTIGHSWPSAKCTDIDLELDGNYKLDLIEDGSDIHRLFWTGEKVTSQKIYDYRFRHLVWDEYQGVMDFTYDSEGRLAKTVHYFDGWGGYDQLYYYTDDKLDSIKLVEQYADSLGVSKIIYEDGVDCGPVEIDFIPDSGETSDYNETYLYKSNCGYLKTISKNGKQFTEEVEYDDMYNPWSVKLPISHPTSLPAIAHPHNIVRKTVINLTSGVTEVFYESSYSYYSNGYPKTETRTSESGSGYVIRYFYSW